MAPIGKKTGTGQGRVRKYRGLIVHCPEVDAQGRRCQRVIEVMGKLSASIPLDALARCTEARGHDFEPPKQGRVGQQKQVKR